jgi:hypothetical protein
MASKPVPEEDLTAAVAAYVKHGGLRSAARALNLHHATLYDRLQSARLRGIKVPDPSATPDGKGRAEVDLIAGTVLVGSDAHYWPGDDRSTAHRAFVHLCKKLKPDIVVVNGDATDLPRVSAHPPLGWTRMPEVKDELEVVAERLGEIAQAAGKKAKRFWPLGNHDARFERYLASRAGELAGVFGSRLVDHFPDWTPCWSLFVNNRPGGAVIKHRGRGGVHATWNNVLHAQRHIITGHLHSQMSRPQTSYNGTLYGVDTGCMADIYGPQFQYLEDGVRNWVSGFAVLTWSGGVMLPPELVTVLEPGAVFWRGEVVDV